MMNWELFGYIALALTTACLMEGVAWFTHKYLMHGVLWFLHKSHHSHHDKALEWNDLFAVLFSVQSMGMIIWGFQNPEWEFVAWIGIGIAIYGTAYAIFHDVIVHNRLPFRFNIKHPYLRRIVKAHGAHHRSQSKADNEAFGFLYAPKKYAPQNKANE